VNSFLSLFEELDISFKDPPKPPNWAKNELFGAYLAGLIDGDGDVRITRPKYPQCVIRISSSKKQADLKEFIEKIMNCKVSINNHFRETKIGERTIKGRWSTLEFYVSSRNKEFIMKYVLPNIALEYKKNKILEYVNTI
jgi:hypothetical protein